MPTMPVQKPGKSKQDYGTPKNFLEAAKKLLNITDWDIDLAASEENKVTQRCYTVVDNSLEQPWAVGQGWNWLNPPFNRIGLWAQRAFEQWNEQLARTALLVPASTGTNWWRDWVHERLGTRIMLLNGRLTFEGMAPNPKTGKVDPYPKDCALVLYGFGIRGYSIWEWQTGRIR